MGIKRLSPLAVAGRTRRPTQPIGLDRLRLALIWQELGFGPQIASFDCGGLLRR